MRTNAIETGKYVVLLIGASRYQTNKYSDILNVETNIEEMKSIFLDKRYIGVREKNIFISLNEDSKAVEHKITDACRAAKNSDYTLFVYYSGHGIINPDNYKLYFATATMDVNYLDTEAIEAKTILDKISRSAASRKIFVVDACHSGGIHNTMGDTSEATLMKNYEGVHYVSACDEDSTALFNRKKPDQPTYFTGALVDRVKNGMDISKPELTLREIVDDIRNDFRFKNLPIPQQSCMLNVDHMPFAHNIKGKNFAHADNNGKKFDYTIATTIIKDDTETKTIKNDNKMWEIACSTNSIEKYNEYLTIFPNGVHIKEAKMKISDLKSKIISRKNVIITLTAIAITLIMIAMPGNNRPESNEVIVVTQPKDTVDTVINTEETHKVERNIVESDYCNYTEERQADTLANLDSTQWKIAINLYNTARAKNPCQRIDQKINKLQERIDSTCANMLYKAYLNAKNVSVPFMRDEAIRIMTIVVNVSNRSDHDYFLDLLYEGDQKEINEWMDSHPIR